MGEAVDDILDGLMCQVCGVWMEDIEEVLGDTPGYSRTCEDCKAFEEDE